jgi:hypothetical protein
MATTGLQLPHISPSQANKTASINFIADGLDGALTQQSVIDVSGGVDVTPSPSAVMSLMPTFRVDAFFFGQGVLRTCERRPSRKVLRRRYAKPSSPLPSSLRLSASLRSA